MENKDEVASNVETPGTQPEKPIEQPASPKEVMNAEPSKTEVHEKTYVPTDKSDTTKPSFAENDYKAVTGKIAKLERDNAELTKKMVEADT